MSSDVEGESVGSSTSTSTTEDTYSTRSSGDERGLRLDSSKKSFPRKHGREEDDDRDSQAEDDDSHSSHSFASLENFVVPDDEWVQSPSTGESEAEVVNDEDVFSEGSSCSSVPKEPASESTDHNKRARGTTRKAALQAGKNIDFIVEKNKEYRELKREWKRRKLQP